MAPLMRLVYAAALFTVATARDLPQSVREFYDNVVNQGECGNALASGFNSILYESDDFVYCNDASRNVVYLQGRSGELSNMDVCCDGIQGGPADDGRCGNDPTLLSITAFQYLVESYNTSQTDLDANVHPYVVFGNAGDTPTFDPAAHGIEPLSLMAVVCNGQLFYGVWGDMNGGAMVGEASISLATACFGTEMNGNYGHTQNDVLYIAFPGDDAVPGASGAAWDAQSFGDFQASISELGDRLIERLAFNNTGVDDGGQEIAQGGGGADHGEGGGGGEEGEVGEVGEHGEESEEGESGDGREEQSEEPSAAISSLPNASIALLSLMLILTVV